MKKVIIILILIFSVKSIISQNHSNDLSHYQKGSSNFGLMILPFPLFTFTVNTGQIHITSSVSYSHFLLKNTEVSISAKHGYYRFFDINYLSELNVFIINPYARYYFLKSKFFIEANYLYGKSTEKGQYNLTTSINNPGVGIGFRRNFYFDNEKLSNHFSLELSRKHVIGTKNYPLTFLKVENRLAIIYHF
jgi:hypothetical protein